MQGRKCSVAPSHNPPRDSPAVLSVKVDLWTEGEHLDPRKTPPPLPPALFPVKKLPLMYMLTSAGEQESTKSAAPLPLPELSVKLESMIEITSKLQQVKGGDRGQREAG
jgi:hypothetical protein